MKAQRRMILLLLVIALMMPACAAGAPQETAAPTQSTQAPASTPTEAPTEAPTEPAEPERFHLSETVFPDTDTATGTLKFYIKGQEIYAGGPVSDLLDVGITTYEDLDQILQPWHISSVLRVRVEMENTRESDLPFVFFLAMNASDEPKSIRDCLFYSITINTDTGIPFGSGKEETPFVTGETTLDEITAAYGEPGYSQSRKADYCEIAYYEPFSCAYFSFKGGKVRQIYTYYAANVFGNLAESFDCDFTGRYFGNDCFILMNQYLDAMPYLLSDEADREAAAAVVDDGKTQQQDAGEFKELPQSGVGIVEKLSECITMAGDELVLGVPCIEMPELFGAPVWDQLMPVHKMRYVRGGRTNPEEFYFINLSEKTSEIANNLVVKGVLTRNMNYVNWGKDYSGFHEFRYENLTQDSTIEDVLEQYGAPKEMHCTSYARGCFAWLVYEDQAGNSMWVCVDPMLDQLVELRVEKYYEGQIYYP